MRLSRTEKILWLLKAALGGLMGVGIWFLIGFYFLGLVGAIGCALISLGQGLWFLQKMGWQKTVKKVLES
jgi:hypothetical protein